MAGENGILSIKQYGRRRVVVTRISFGIEFNNSDSNLGRNRRMFQTHHVTSGQMNVRLAFNSQGSHEDFMLWLQGYMRRVSDPDLPSHPIRFTCPVRRIDKMVVLKSGVTFGDKVAQAVYPADLTFREITDLVTLNEDNRSVFVLPEADDPALPRFYPAGSQLDGRAVGKDYAEDTEYDSSPPSIPEVF